jgi:hypothetical protein
MMTLFLRRARAPIPFKAAICNLAALLTLLASGCSALDVDKKESMESGLMPFSHGEVATKTDASLKRTWAAAQKAAKELGMRIEQLQYTPPTATMVVWEKVGKRMEVHLKKAGYSSTTVVIQMGPKGDELLQRQFLSKLENSL